MSQRCVDQSIVDLWGEGRAHDVTSARRGGRRAAIRDDWYSCSCGRHWWRGRVMSLMERMLLVARGVEPFPTPEQRSDPGDVTPRQLAMSAPAVDYFGLEDIGLMNVWGLYYECIMSIHPRAVSCSQRMPNTGEPGKRRGKKTSQYRWWCTRPDNAHFRVN